MASRSNDTCVIAMSKNTRSWIITKIVVYLFVPLD